MCRSYIVGRELKGERRHFQEKTVTRREKVTGRESSSEIVPGKERERGEERERREREKKHKEGEFLGEKVIKRERERELQGERIFRFHTISDDTQ